MPEPVVDDPGPGPAGASGADEATVSSSLTCSTPATLPQQSRIFSFVSWSAAWPETVTALLAPSNCTARLSALRFWARM